MSNAIEQLEAAAMFLRSARDRIDLVRPVLFEGGNKAAEASLFRGAREIENALLLIGKSGMGTSAATKGEE